MRGKKAPLNHVQTGQLSVRKLTAKSYIYLHEIISPSIDYCIIIFNWARSGFTPFRMHGVAEGRAEAIPRARTHARTHAPNETGR